MASRQFFLTLYDGQACLPLYVINDYLALSRGAMISRRRMSLTHRTGKHIWASHVRHLPFHYIMSGGSIAASNTDDFIFEIWGKVWAHQSSAWKRMHGVNLCGGRNGGAPRNIF
eukprot:GHVU01080133.1.p6 GENE.GHVU01080133.1~~GHVU01080133.1.p6  ORF type:complete len:114 (-),score=2.29 GHVU01080133.1:3612-3953(-)